MNYIDLMLKEIDKNDKIFRELFQSDDWYNDNKGKYIAIVDEKVVGICEGREELLNKIRSEYLKKQRYFTKINREVEVINMPTPLEIVY